MPEAGPAWPDPDNALIGIEDWLARTGTRMRLLSRDKFEAGLARARTAHGYDPDASLGHLAAIMFEGITTQHPFQDGNKRAALLCALTFLLMNGRYLDAEEDALERVCRATVAGEQSVDALARFFEDHLVDDLA